MIPHSFRIACLGLGALLALGACDKMKAEGEKMKAEGDKAVTAVESSDTCGAATHQSLVGQSAASLDPASLPAGTRVIFPGMPVTMDLREERMNVEVGSGDKVARVFCG